MVQPSLPVPNPKVYVSYMIEIRNNDSKKPFFFQKSIKIILPIPF
jgi:hypothetical protein